MAAIKRAHLAVAAVTFVATAVIGWPILAEVRSLASAVLALVVMWVWLVSLVGIGAVPHPYHWLVAALAIALSFASPLLSLWASGAAFEAFAKLWLAIASFFTVLCVVIFKRASDA